MNDFLTRFVWIMPGGWKRVVLNICLVLWRLFSGDLWKTEWEVSNAVLKDMEKERKEKMMGFLQCEEVREMRTFSGEIGIRGDMLREFRFKWACEKMEESGFYERLTRVREEEKAAEEGRNCVTRGEEKPKVVTLPMRHGKMKHKIYGLDLSDPEWAEVADRIHESEERDWPEEPKPISGKCKLVTGYRENSSTKRGG